LGVGVIGSGRVSDSMGTYECLAAASDEPKLGDKSFAARLNSYSHVVPGKFLTLAYFPSGIMIQWFRDLIYGHGVSPTDSKIAANEQEKYSILEAHCTNAASGLLITPHLFGTCNPDFDPRARAMIFGLGAGSNKSQIYQGILEGIACELAQLTEILADVCGKFTDLYVSGGGARSPLGLRLRAAITGCRLHVVKCDEAVCQGAAILAGVAMSTYAGIEDAVKIVVREKEIIEPDTNLTAAYSDQSKNYRRLYATLKEFRDTTSCAQPEAKIP
jgi:xylulokinase